MPQDPYLSVLIKAIDQLAELPVSWLPDKKLVQIKGILTDQQPAELRNRKSKVHLSASAMVFSKMPAFLFVIRIYEQHCCRPATLNRVSCRLTAQLGNFMKKPAIR
jgi:dihydroneopterin triphosphate pyrophosphohydrolase